MQIDRFVLQKEQETKTKAGLVARGNCTCRLSLQYIITCPYLFVAHFPIKLKEEHSLLR